MKRRRVPRAISKRLDRKLRRSKRPYLLWLQIIRPHVYARLKRLQWWQLMNAMTSISPMMTPFLSMAPRVVASSLVHEWVLDDLKEFPFHEEA